MGHQKDVYSLSWSPTGPKSEHPGMDLQLATYASHCARIPATLSRASFDHMAKVWNVETGQCLHTMANHTETVYSLSYSPNGQYIATGSFDKTVNIWSARVSLLTRMPSLACHGHFVCAFLGRQATQDVHRRRGHIRRLVERHQ